MVWHRVGHRRWLPGANSIPCRSCRGFCLLRVWSLPPIVRVRCATSSKRT